MKNYLVITLGTREIQLPVNKIEEHNFEVIEEKGEKFSKFFVQKINDPSIRIEVKQPSKEFPDFFTISPRTTGEIVNDNYHLFRPIIDFPIVRPATEYLKQKKVSLDIIMLVYTDQEEAFKSGKVKFQNKENDSLFYADIISKLIKEDSFFLNTEIDQFAITHNVTDLGYQYDDFKRINEFLLYSEEVKQVFLYPQGGIDQINQALVLRLIEIFKEKVKQLQKAEGADFKELDFPSKFLSSLNKQKILKHLEDYDFGLIDKSVSKGMDKRIYHIAQYAHKRLNLQYDLIEINKRAIPDYPLIEFVDNEESKIKDIYLSAKINYYQGKYTEFLWKIYTLNEALFKIEIKKIVGNAVETYYKLNDPKYKTSTPWEDLLNRLDPSFVHEISKHKMPNGIPVDTKNPNRAAFKILLKLFVKHNFLSLPKLDLYEKIGDKLEALSSERNKIAHNLGSTNIAQINAILNIKEQEYSCKKLLEDLDNILNIKGFDIYDDIQLAIKQLLES